MNTSELIPQPHGGALSPGNPGNKGGGRHKDKIRELAREAGNKAVQRLKKLLEDEDSKLSAQEVRSICDVLLKYGVGTQQETELKLVGDDAFKQAFFDTLAEFDVDMDDFSKRLEAKLKQ